MPSHEDVRGRMKDGLRTTTVPPSLCTSIVGYDRPIGPPDRRLLTCVLHLATNHHVPLPHLRLLRALRDRIKGPGPRHRSPLHQRDLLHVLRPDQPRDRFVDRSQALAGFLSGQVPSHFGFQAEVGRHGGEDWGVAWGSLRRCRSG